MLKRRAISPAALAELRRRGVPAIMAELQKMPRIDLSRPEIESVFEISPGVSVTRHEAEQWLAKESVKKDAWMKFGAICAAIGAVAAIIAAVR